MDADLTRALHRAGFQLENQIANDPQRSERERHAIYLALAGIRQAEDRMASAASWIRSSLEDADRALATDRGLNSRGVLQGQATDFDQAIALRETHWAALAALLTETELAGYRAARKSARETARTATEEAGMETVAREMFPAEYAAIDDDHSMDPAKVQAVKNEVARRQTGDPR